MRYIQLDIAQWVKDTVWKPRDPSRVEADYQRLCYIIALLLADFD